MLRRFLLLMLLLPACIMPFSSAYSQTRVWKDVWEQGAAPLVQPIYDEDSIGGYATLWDPSKAGGPLLMQILSPKLEDVHRFELAAGGRKYLLAAASNAAGYLFALYAPSKRRLEWLALDRKGAVVQTETMPFEGGDFAAQPGDTRFQGPLLKAVGPRSFLRILPVRAGGAGFSVERIGLDLQPAWRLVVPLTGFKAPLSCQMANDERLLALTFVGEARAFEPATDADVFCLEMNEGRVLFRRALMDPPKRLAPLHVAVEHGEVVLTGEYFANAKSAGKESAGVFVLNLKPDGSVARRTYLPMNGALKSCLLQFGFNLTGAKSARMREYLILKGVTRNAGDTYLIYESYQKIANRKNGNYYLCAFLSSAALLPCMAAGYAFTPLTMRQMESRQMIIVRLDSTATPVQAHRLEKSNRVINLTGLQTMRNVHALARRKQKIFAYSFAQSDGPVRVVYRTKNGRRCARVAATSDDVYQDFSTSYAKVAVLPGPAGRLLYVGCDGELGTVELQVVK